jgi:transposase
MKNVNEALDVVRRVEQQEDPVLIKTRFLWLKNKKKPNEKQEEIFLGLKDTNLKTAKAYRIKLVLQAFWTKTKWIAPIYFNECYQWAIRSRLEPMVKVAKTLTDHKQGILRWFITKMTNGFLEGINRLVQAVKRKARGYHTTDNLIAMTYATVNKLDIKVPLNWLG